MSVKRYLSRKRSITKYIVVGDGLDVWKKQHRCNYVVKYDDGKKRCGILFPNVRQLKLHKTQAGHQILKRKRKRPGNEQPVKQLRLEQCLFATPNIEEEVVNDPDGGDEDGDENDEEDVVECVICKVVFVFVFVQPKHILNISLLSTLSFMYRNIFIAINVPTTYCYRCESRF